MANFGLILLCMLAGMLLGRFRVFPENAAVTLNRFIIHVSLPAITLFHVHQMHFGNQILYPVAMPMLIFMGAAAVFVTLGKAYSWDRKTVGALILVSGLGNTSFLGFPMLEALFGPQALETGILTDQPGSFMTLSILGILTACYYSGSRIRIGDLGRKLVRFPPFGFLVLALCLRPWDFPVVLDQMLVKLGDTLMPLALFSVGLQLRFQRAALQAEKIPLMLGLAYKMVLGPALITLLYAGVFGGRGEVIQVSIVQSAMAPMITAGIVASEYQLNTRLSSLMLGIGIPLSLLTVPIWWWLVKGL